MLILIVSGLTIFSYYVIISTIYKIYNVERSNGNERAEDKNRVKESTASADI
jgi:hypothetical protein